MHQHSTNLAPSPATDSPRSWNHSETSESRPKGPTSSPLLCRLSAHINPSDPSFQETQWITIGKATDLRDSPRDRDPFNLIANTTNYLGSSLPTRAVFRTR